MIFKMIEFGLRIVRAIMRVLLGLVYRLGRTKIGFDGPNLFLFG